MEFTQDHIQGTGVFPEHPILFVDRDGQTRLRLMRWGAVEFWTTEVPDYKSKDFKYIQKLNWKLNARAERILDDKTSYWYKIRNNRCLIPVTGIFEHRGITTWKNKLPYHVRPQGQKIMFFLPGLYSVYKVVDKETGEITEHWTFSLITRGANEVMCMIHNGGDNPYRMPLFVPLPVAREFLVPGLTEERYWEMLAYSIPSEELDYYTIFTIRSSKPHPLGGRKHEPYDWPENPPPALGTMNPPVKEKTGG
jgi:putative SOS response-associated peptidase YedK